jgi:hypothetical protein
MRYEKAPSNKPSSLPAPCLLHSPVRRASTFSTLKRSNPVCLRDIIERLLLAPRLLEAPAFTAGETRPADFRDGQDRAPSVSAASGPIDISDLRDV